MGATAQTVSAASPTDVDLVELCQATYAPPGSSVAWDHFEPGAGSTGVCWGLKYFRDADVVAFRGTADLPEWFDDFDFVAAPTKHPQLNDVHAGFLIGMDDAWARIRSLRRPWADLVFTGHSLGADRADVACGLAILDGDIPAARVVFGEPYPGFASFCSLLAPIRRQASYCNGDGLGHDMVTEVPFPIRPVWPYARPTPLTSVSASPTDPADLDAFRYHHIQLYVRAVQAGPMALVAPIPLKGLAT